MAHHPTTTHLQSGLLRALALLTALSLSAPAQEPVPATPPPQPAPSPSLVTYVSNEEAFARYREDPAAVRIMVDAVITKLTGETKIGPAWSKLLGPVGPNDKIGIKVSSAGGRLFSTRPSVVRAIVAGLGEAGVPAKRIIVWDKTMAGLRTAGFVPGEFVCPVKSVEPPTGWDRTASFQAPVLGKLIWGDLLFVGKAKGMARNDAPQLSSKSHLATILSKDVTKFINVPVLTDEPGCGVAGAFYNATVGNLDNWRRFSAFGQGGAASLPDLYADPLIGGKAVVHILDALTGQYAGGPEANPNYVFPHATIYASCDPVALDHLGLDMIEQWRVKAKLPPIGAKGAWLQMAAQLGLGQNDNRMISLQSATP